MPNRLITIGPSHYCEKARWALDRLGLSYREERHPPVFHALAARRAGGQRTTPVLITEDGVFTDSTDILHTLDARAPNESRLYPEDATLRAEVERLEEELDEGLGPHARRYVYYYLLDHPRMRPLMTLEVASRTERALFRMGLPLVKLMMRKLMRIDAEGARRSEAKIMETWETIDGLLADGRTYLVGDRFSAADLTFAALAAPLVVPAEYGFPLPERSELPAPLLAKVDALRARPAGAFALRLFREERRRPAAPASAQ